MRSHSKLFAGVLSLLIGIALLWLGLFGENTRTMKIQNTACTIISILPILIGIYLLFSYTKAGLKNTKVRTQGEEHEAIVTAIINRTFEQKRYMHLQVRYKDANGVNQERVLYNYKIANIAPVGSTIRIREYDGSVAFIEVSDTVLPYKNELMAKDCEAENPYIKHKAYRFMTVDEYRDLHMDTAVNLTKALVGEEHIDDILSEDNMNEISDAAKASMIREHLKDVAEEKLGIPEATSDKIIDGARKFKDFRGGFRL